MTTVLTEIEARVLGSLIEKQVTTPEYYPLTLNALTLACNQKNNRHPVTSYTENQVADAVESLREKNLSYVFYGSQPKVGASPEDLVSFYDGDRTRILIGSVVFGFAILCLMWFAAALASVLRDAEKGG